MKNILPIISLIGASSLLVGCANAMQTKKEAFIGNLNEFQEDLTEYTSLNDNHMSKTVMNKYNLDVVSDNLDTLATLEEKPADNKKTNYEQIMPINDEINYNKEETIENNNTNAENQKISTLYSLSDDISNSCDDFCELKKDLTSAIIETQNLINKVNNKEIELTKEQKMFITEQSMQLKSLGRQLSNITSELSFHLSDLNNLTLTNGENIDSLNMKYLIVLDNLVNGNEMLQSSLSSLNLINQMFNTSETLPPNNHGRILYGFQRNNNPPVMKDYYIDENGDLIENPSSNNSINNSSAKESKPAEEKNSNVDTYQNNHLKTNIDTYQNNNTPHNIDTFFNTALLDNEFMYGNGRFNNGMYGGSNPYMYNYANYERNNTQYGINNQQNTPNSETDNLNNLKKEDKKRKLKKNIDTYKDANEPDIKTKLANIKNSISGFFSKFKKSDLNDKIDNPIYRFDATNESKN